MDTITLPNWTYANNKNSRRRGPRAPSSDKDKKLINIEHRTSNIEHRIRCPVYIGNYRAERFHNSSIVIRHSLKFHTSKVLVRDPDWIATEYRYWLKRKHYMTCCETASFILSQKTWSSGPGQSSSAMP